MNDWGRGKCPSGLTVRRSPRASLRRDKSSSHVVPNAAIGHITVSGNGQKLSMAIMNGFLDDAAKGSTIKHSDHTMMKNKLMQSPNSPSSGIVFWAI